jgi:hypothetical protein
MRNILSCTWPPQKIRKHTFIFQFPGYCFGFSDGQVALSAKINFSGAGNGYNFARTKPKKPNVMKTIAKSLIAISILMISFQVIAGGNQTTLAKIHYKVQIHLPRISPFYTRNLFVVMTDANNKLVAPAELLRYEKLSYDFYEAPSVKGTRKAQLVYSDGTTARLFNSAPDVQNGSFILGGNYIFNLYVEFPTGQNPTTAGE